MSRLLAPVIALGLMLAACEGVALEGGDCGRVYDGGCAQVMEELTARWPDQVRRVDLNCALPTCGRERGAGTALVTFGDGRSTVVPWAYEGTPAPEPGCVDLDPLVCRTAFDAFVAGQPPSPGIVRATMTCEVECTWSGGDVRVDLAYDDGSTSRQGYGWEGGFPLPSGYSSLPSIRAGVGASVAPDPPAP